MPALFPASLQVREAISMLDLDVMVYPCPKEGTTWRPKVRTSCTLHALLTQG